MDFIGEEEEFVDRSKKRRQGGRPQINRKTKLTLVFDPEARRKFLTGFRKRKQERKERYQEKLNEDLAEEKRKMREEAKKSVAKKQSSSHSVLPEVQHLLETSSSDDDEEQEETGETYQIGHTTVSISTPQFPNQLIQLKSPVPNFSGANSDEDDDEEDEPLLSKKTKELDASKALIHKDSLKLKSLKRALRNPTASANKRETETLVRKEAHRLLQHSDIYKKALRVKQKKSRKFKLNRLQPKEENDTSNKVMNSKGKSIKTKKTKNKNKK